MDDEQAAFICDPRSVADARRWLARLLEGWGRPDLVDTGILLLSETVTNSIQHVRSSVHLVVTRLNDHVRVEVWDDGSTNLHPSVRDPRPYAEGGRGLFLVERLSSAWGVMSGRRGRAVYFELGA